MDWASGRQTGTRWPVNFPIRTARLYAVPHAGHELNADAPDTVAQVVRESFDRL